MRERMDEKTKRRLKRVAKRKATGDRGRKQMNQLFSDDEKGEQEKDNFLKLGQKANVASSYSHYNHHIVNFLVNGEVVKYIVQIIPDGATFSFTKHWKLTFVLISCMTEFQNFARFAEAYAEFGLVFFFFHLISTLFFFVCYATALFIGCRFAGHLHKLYLGFVGLVIYQAVISFQRFFRLSRYLTVYMRYVFLTAHPYFPPWRNCFNGPFAERNLTWVNDCVMKRIKTIELETTFGNIFTLILFLIAFGSISGSVESWWKVSFLFVIWPVFCCIILWILSLTKEGATVGLLHMFRVPVMDAGKWQACFEISFLRTQEQIVLGLVHVESLGKMMEKNLPVIKLSAIAVLTSFVFSLLAITVMFMLTGVNIFHYCNPPADSFRKYCSYAEKLEDFETSLKAIKKGGEFSTSLATAFPIIASSMTPSANRLFCLTYFCCQFPTALTYLFCLLFILQNEIMRWPRFSRVFTWRTGSYIVILFFFLPVFILPVIGDITLTYFCHFVAPSTVAPEFSNVIVCFQLIAVYWIYGSVNFLNDIYVSRQSILPMGFLVAFIGRYIAVPVLLLHTVLCAIRTYKNFGNHFLPMLPFAPWLQRLEFFWWAYVGLVVIPLLVCLGKRQRISEWRATNLKKENGWPQIKMSKFTLFLMGGTCYSSAEDFQTKKQN